MRYILAGIVLSLCAGLAQGTPINLNLGTPAPAGTVKLTSGSFNNLSVYAGVLNWTDASNSSLKYSTYCIDLSATISQSGNPWTFELKNIADVTGSGPGQYTSAQINAMENLWLQHPAEGNVGFGVTPLITAGQAAMFQTALWKILNPSITYNTPGSGFTQTQLNAATTDVNNWVQLALAAGTYTGPADFQVLVSTDGGQNQAMYLVAPSSQPPPAPLPSSLLSGATLLGGLAFVRRRARRGRA